MTVVVFDLTQICFDLLIILDNSGIKTSTQGVGIRKLALGSTIWTKTPLGTTQNRTRLASTSTLTSIITISDKRVMGLLFFKIFLVFRIFVV